VYNYTPYAFTASAVYAIIVGVLYNYCAARTRRSKMSGRLGKKKKKKKKPRRRIRKNNNKIENNKTFYILCESDRDITRRDNSRRLQDCGEKKLAEITI